MLRFEGFLGHMSVHNWQETWPTGTPDAHTDGSNSRERYHLANQQRQKSEPDGTVKPDQASKPPWVHPPDQKQQVHPDTGVHPTQTSAKQLWR